MKKITAFSLLCLLAFGAASCSDGNDGPAIPSDTITVGNETHPVARAFHFYEPAEEFEEGAHMILLYKDYITEIPTEPGGFFVGVVVSDSYLGKEIDLTKTLAANGDKFPIVQVATVDRLLEIDDETHEVYGSSDEGHVPSNLTVKSGKMIVTRTGDEFTVKLAVEFSDNHRFGADWQGTVTNVPY